MNRLLRISFRTCLLTSILLITACGGGGGGSSDPEEVVEVLQKLANLITSSYMLDVDKDGDLDIIVGVQGSADKTADILLINDGSGNFSIKEGAFPDHHLGIGGATVNIESADFNNDGNADIIASTTDARADTFDDTIQIQLYLGNGDGTFTDATANITGGLVTEYIEWIRVADFDGDNNMDFLITSNGCSESGPNYGNCHGGRIFLNDGNTNFAVATISTTDAEMTYTETKLVWDSDGNIIPSNTGASRIALDVFVADINGDNKPDLIAPNGYTSNGAIATFINTTTTPGALTFNIVYTVDPIDPFDGGTGFKNGALMDINGDGLLDMVGSQSIAGGDNLSAPLFAFIGQADGSFVEDNSVFDPAQPGVEHARQWIVDDFNNDGKDDLIVADHGFDASPFPGEKNILLLNDGAGKLVDVSNANLGTLSSFTHGGSSGDIDGDGFADLFLNNAEVEPNPFFTAEIDSRLWINNGDGSFTARELNL